MVLAEALDGTGPAVVQVDTVFAVDVRAVAGAVAPDAVVGWGRPPGTVATLGRERVVAVLGSGDPLAAGSSVPVAALRARTVWMWSRTTAAADWDRLVDHVDPTRGAVEVVDTRGSPAQERIIAAVADEGGCTLAPARYLQQARPADIVGRDLDPPLSIPVTISWRATPSPGLQHLLDGWWSRGSPDDSAGPAAFDFGGIADLAVATSGAVLLLAAGVALVRLRRPTAR